MQSRGVWLALAGLVALVLVTGGDAQQPGKRGKKGGGPGARLSTEQIVERILSFDKNGDGVLTKDELPERMQSLFEKGDLNKDGVLDKEEIRKLATTLAQEGFGGRGGPFGDFAPFAKAGGKGGKGKGKGGFGGGFGPRGGADRALASLDLSGPAKEKAAAVVKAHDDNVRKLLEMAHSDLLLKMKDVLNESQYKDFKAALDRPPGGFVGLPPGGFGAKGKGDLERRLDLLQREVDDLRRKLDKK